MKNIWIINHYAIPPSLGGLSRHYYFKRELDKLGYNVKIFTSAQIHNSGVNMLSGCDDFIKEIEVDGVNYHFIKSSTYKGNGISRIKNMLEFSLNIKKIPKHIKDKPDIIYTSSPDLFTAYYAEKLAKKLKVPCIVEIRDLWPESIVEYKKMSKNNLIIKALYWLEKKIYARADKLVFTMEGGADYIKERKLDKKIDLNKIYNINNGVDIKLFESNKLNYTVFDENLDDDTFKVIYCGSIRQVNNIGQLVEVAEKMKDNDKIKFLIYGQGDKRAKLEDYCAKNNLKNIVFKGQVDKKFVPYILSKAGCNLIAGHQTRIAQFGISPNKLFDYFAAGRPVISNVKSNYDLIERYQCGAVTESQDTRLLVDEVLRIYCLDSETYLQMCKNARLAAEDYDFKVLTDKLVQIIESV